MFVIFLIGYIILINKKCTNYTRFRGIKMRNNLEIGMRIRGIRENLHMSRNSFSELINISEVFLAQVERGERAIGMNTLMSICKNTGYSSDYILFGKEADNIVGKKIVRMVDKMPENSLDLCYEIIRSINTHQKAENN